jgi:hypothetical protein
MGTGILVKDEYIDDNDGVFRPNPCADLHDVSLESIQLVSTPIISTYPELAHTLIVVLAPDVASTMEFRASTPILLLLPGREGCADLARARLAFV